jgi:hypothetical protein
MAQHMQRRHAGTVLRTSGMDAVSPSEINSYETWYIEIPNKNRWTKLILLRDCYVISVPWLRVGDRGIGIRFPAHASNYLFCHVQTGSRDHPA